ncbi:MAG: hypothetical protein NXI10_02800 [bacterium]|nr:hypothetical protein [bacterium]
MTKKLLLLLILFSGFFCFGQSDTLKTDYPGFEDILDSMNMTFIAPKNMEETAPIENRQMNYEKAYRDTAARFEVRYALRRHNMGFIPQIFEATTLNISGGHLPEYSIFGSEAVKNEFGADGGATVGVPVGTEFGQEYQYCLLVYIHKTGIGDAYMFYLADDQSIIGDRMSPLFHNLRFEE